jgi:hypothetical protein
MSEGHETRQAANSSSCQASKLSIFKAVKPTSYQFVSLQASQAFNSTPQANNLTKAVNFIKKLA